MQSAALAPDPRTDGWRRKVLVGLGAVLLGAVIGAATPSFMNLVRSWGHRIPQPAIEADYLVGLLWATFLGLTILFWPVSRSHRRALIALWGVRVFVTLGFMLLYEWNYGLDAYNYFEISTRPRYDFSGTGFGLGTQNLEGMAWLHSAVLPDSYHAMKVSFAMVGLLAVYILYRAAVRFMGKEDLRLLFFVGLFPSVLFWSSILGKDPVQLLGIAIYTYGVIYWRTGSIVRGVSLIVIGILLAAYIRMWSAPILLFPLAVFTILGFRGLATRTTLLLVSSAALLFAIVQFNQMIGFQTIEDVVSMADEMSQEDGWSGGSGQQYDVRFTGVPSMLLFMPVGMFAALFRPLPGEVLNPFGLMAGFENLLLLGLLMVAIIRSKWIDLKEPLVIWAGVLVVSWAGVYGFISAYNLGAAVRFKLQILPALLFLLLYLARKRKTPPVPVV